jgi:hypothetical protein
MHEALERAMVEADAGAQTVLVPVPGLREPIGREGNLRQSELGVATNQSVWDTSQLLHRSNQLFSGQPELFSLKVEHPQFDTNVSLRSAVSHRTEVGKCHVKDFVGLLQPTEIQAKPSEVVPRACC